AEAAPLNRKLAAGNRRHRPHAGYLRSLTALSSSKSHRIRSQESEARGQKPEENQHRGRASRWRGNSARSAILTPGFWLLIGSHKPEENQRRRSTWRLAGKLGAKRHSGSWLLAPDSFLLKVYPLQQEQHNGSVEARYEIVGHDAPASGQALRVANGEGFPNV